MIDYFNITFKGEDFPDIGKTVLTSHNGGAQTQSFTDVKVCAKQGAPHFTARVETKARRMRFNGSPAQWLQGHNGMGSNDFQAVVKASVLLVFKTLNLPCPPSVVDAITTGDYEVHEVHVAEHYRMSRALIPQLCTSIRRYSPTSLEATSISPGIGVRLWPASRDRTVLIYDKYHYFLDKPLRHKTKLLGDMPFDFDRVGTSLYFDRMKDEVLDEGVRIETRHLRSLKSKKHPLDRGSLWLPETARELHIATVKEIPLQDLPPVDHREMLCSDTDRMHRTLIALWLDGRDPSHFCPSPATYYRNRSAILRKHGIDLSVPATLDGGLCWSELIDDSSIIEPPEWALESGFLFEPDRWVGWSEPTQNERAWLSPNRE